MYIKKSTKRNTNIKIDKNIHWYLLVTALFMTLLTIYDYVSVHNIESDAIHTEGVIIKIVKHARTKSSGGHSTDYYPVVKFHNDIYGYIQFKSEDSDVRVKIGDKVPVLYQKAHPTRAMIDHGFNYGKTLLFLLVSLVLYGISYKFYKYFKL